MSYSEQAPRHVGIIMDGNGRWAERRSQPRVFGHRAGAKAVRSVTEEATRMGIGQLTLFAFSTENWKRPPEEVKALMLLFGRYLRGEEERLLNNGIRLRAVGRLHELPKDVHNELERVMTSTQNGSALTLCLAINYGGHTEIADACKKLAERATSGAIRAEDIDEQAIQDALYQPDMPPLDLVIRTGGEMRLSNFLLWQAAYAELYLTPTYWPDFDGEQLRVAIADFHARNRRFGGLNEPQRKVG
ncbi:MAG: di-trans,poly-cis-decaprenylcistransferase [Deltaproteobacteria bacterium RIFOXYA12_FULL_58_15]|nr:MAG: di-trans,poly-cis-decaprenylcistransferase [Deltaproteobacteria bacterium RIFOXYA12_FULL_58_15]OGR09660.1 MAG: di-trans,poly-cis-decaprenylcistransferase [Deltaproteobacteria bacterium RIFOXYB12_FULL_58_9]